MKQKLIILFALIPCMSFAGWNLGSYYKVRDITYTSSVDSGTFEASNVLHAAAEAGLTNYALSIAGGLGYQSNLVIAAADTNAAQQAGINANSNGVLAVSNQMVLSTQALVGGLGYVSNMVIAAAATNAWQAVGIAANSNAILAAATTNAEQELRITCASNMAVAVSNQMAGTTQALVGGLANVSNLAVWASNNSGLGWSLFPTTNQIVWSNVWIGQTNYTTSNDMLLTGTGINPDATGRYYFYSTVEAPLSNRWTNANGFLIYCPEANARKYGIYTQEIAGKSLFMNPVNNCSPTGTYEVSGEAEALGGATGTLTAVYFPNGDIITNSYIWTYGTASASSNVVALTLNGSNLVKHYATSNVFTQPIYGPGDGLTGIPDAAVPGLTNYPKLNASSNVFSGPGFFPSLEFTNGVTLKVGKLSGTNGIYFYQPATGSNYWILTP